MSWDLIAYNYKGQPPGNDEMMSGDGPDPTPLGDPATIRKKIDKHLGGVVWSDAKNGAYEHNEVSIEFTIGGDPIDHIFLSVGGSGNVLRSLVAFAKPNHWSIYDVAENEFLVLGGES